MPNIDEIEILKALLFEIKPGQILNWYRLKPIEKNERFFKYSFKDVSLYAYRDNEVNQICFFYLSSMQRLSTVHLYFTLSSNLYPEAIDLETIINDQDFEHFDSITTSISFQQFSESIISLTVSDKEKISSFEKENFHVSQLFYEPFNDKLFFDKTGEHLQIPFFENKKIVNVLKYNKTFSQLQIDSSVGIWSAHSNVQNIQMALFNNVQSLSAYFVETLPDKDFAIMVNANYSEQNIIQIFTRFFDLRYKKIVIPCFTNEDLVFALSVICSFINSYLKSFRKYKLNCLGASLYELQVRSNVEELQKEDSKFFVEMITLNFIEPNYKCLTFENIQTPVYKIMHFRFVTKKEMVLHFIRTLLKEENCSDIITIDLKF